jgi:hypothetical protein
MVSLIVDFFIYDKKDFISKNIFKKLIYVFFLKKFSSPSTSQIKRRIIYIK